MIIPDYELPSAMMVALFSFDTQETLELLAKGLAQHVGLILVGPNGYELQEFADKSGYLDRIAVISTEFDSPWIRDHAPIAVRDVRGIHQVLPLRPNVDRPKDRAFFPQLLIGTYEQTQVALAAGNLIAGPDGIAISTSGIFEENDIRENTHLDETAQQLGIKHWLIIDPFKDDISQHADCMVRFLSPDLCAVVRRPDCAFATKTIDELVKDLLQLRPNLRIINIPSKAIDGTFNSPVNWVQLDRQILIPQFGQDDPNGVNAASILEAEGFVPTLIPCQTSGLGGGLHCLSASIFSD